MKIRWVQRIQVVEVYAKEDVYLVEKAVANNVKRTSLYPGSEFHYYRKGDDVRCDSSFSSS